MKPLKNNAYKKQDKVARNFFLRGKNKKICCFFFFFFFFVFYFINLTVFLPVQASFLYHFFSITGFAGVFFFFFPTRTLCGQETKDMGGAWGRTLSLF